MGRRHWGPLCVLVLPACGLVYDFDALREDGSGAASNVTDAGSTTNASVASTSSGGGVALGEPCSDAAACASGFCAGGICCAEACDGPCQACGPGGACGVRAVGSECAPGTCNAGTLSPPSTCTQAGECETAGKVPCAMGECAGNICAGCTAQDCDATTYCPPEGGSCVPKLAQGEPCTGSNQCASGFCADDVCCDTACASTCESCNASGVCTVHAAGSDADGECAPEGGCGKTGECSGTSAACALTPVSTPCAAASCAAGTVTLASSCDGGGTCVAGMTASCGNYACDDANVGCRTSCSVASHCTNGTMCIGNQCRADNGVGNACPNGPSDCPLGFCVDGFCCATACTGACTACSQARTGAANGQCTNVTDFTDPNDSCLVGSGCGQSGLCVAGQCALAPAGTACGAMCVGHGFIGMSCDSGGVCTANSSGYVDCGEPENCCIPMNGMPAYCDYSSSCPMQ